MLLEDCGLVVIEEEAFGQQAYKTMKAMVKTLLEVELQKQKPAPAPPPEVKPTTPPKPSPRRAKAKRNPPAWSTSAHGNRPEAQPPLRRSRGTKRKAPEPNSIPESTQSSETVYDLLKQDPRLDSEGGVAVWPQGQTPQRYTCSALRIDITEQPTAALVVWTSAWQAYTR
jgi:hypothetical protein